MIREGNGAADNLEGGRAERLCLSIEGAVAIGWGTPPQPMYKGLPEVLSLIKMLIEERRRTRVDFLKTVESGVIEEYVVFEKGTAGRRLLFRAWPVFFPFLRRLEYQLYIKDPDICKDILGYLKSCACANQAALVQKS